MNEPSEDAGANLSETLVGQEVHRGVRRLRLSSIRVDARISVRRQLSEHAVQQFVAMIKNGVELPPITVARASDADNMYVVVDGLHRVEAIKRARGDKPEYEVRVAATVTKAKTIDEARWLAGEVNVRNGQPLKAEEYREMFRAYVRAIVQPQLKLKAKRRGLSYRGIALALGGGRSHMTIHRWMTADFPKIAEQLGKPEDGHDEEPPTGRVGGGATRGLLRGGRMAIASAMAIIDPERRVEQVEKLRDALASVIKQAREGEQVITARDGFDL